MNLRLKKVKSKVAQSCPTLCDPMNCSLPGSSIHGIFQARVLGVDWHFLLQGIFPTQGLNPGLPHYRQMLYCLSHQGSQNTEDTANETPQQPYLGAIYSFNDSARLLFDKHSLDLGECIRRNTLKWPLNTWKSCMNTGET